MRSAMEWRHVTLLNEQTIATGIKILEFQVDHSLAAFVPGSHVSFTVYIDNQPQLRSYSCLPSEVYNGKIRIAVKHHDDSRGGSRYMWSLRAGNKVMMSLPENRFELSFKSPEYLLVAGGIGITPIYGMAKALRARSKKFRLVYAARSRDEMLFREELENMRDANIDFFPSSEGRRLNLKKEIDNIPDKSELYFCGPLEMLDDARSLWKAAGHEIENFRFEMFGNSGHAPSEEFDVVIPAYNTSVHVDKGQTLLQALGTAGIPMISDCRRGECGLCTVDIIQAESDIDHRDVFFSEEEKRQNLKMCACVSRAVGGTIVIDTGYRK